MISSLDTWQPHGKHCPHLNTGKEEGCCGTSITSRHWGPGQGDDELGSHWPRHPGSSSPQHFSSLRAVGHRCATTCHRRLSPEVQTAAQTPFRASQSTMVGKGAATQKYGYYIKFIIPYPSRKVNRIYPPSNHRFAECE